MAPNRIIIDTDPVSPRNVLNRACPEGPVADVEIRA